MDTKTPPIPQKQHLERLKFKTPTGSSPVQVSLPPLTPPPNRRQRLKTHGSPWAHGHPGINGSNNGLNNHHSDRPYRVLYLGATPLMHACQQADRSRVLRLLKEQRETIGYRDRTLRSALHYCMDAGSGGAVATAAPELVNTRDVEGHTPLHLAVIAGDSQLVAVLLANGADVNAKDLEGHSVLHWATVCGEVECVRLVLAAGARPSTPDMRGGSPLHYAAQCCGAAAPMEIAVPKKAGLKVLQSLLDYGANCNAKDEDGRQPFLWAASAGSVEAVLALARAGGSAAAGASDKDGLTALHCAASRGHAGCVEALINLCGSQPDHVDDNGCSALHYAATLGHADATGLLLRLGADPNRQDRKGRTPALCAAAKGQLETLKLLAQHGGSLHARTVRGSGVAHEAAASGRVELIKWLAKKRPGILDIATHDGRTPLHVAALHGHVDACKILLDNGARINAILRTTKGSQMTALDAALYRGHRDCAKLIQMHGGSTAQHIKSQKADSHKEFAAKLRVKCEEMSSQSENTPKRRRRKRRGLRNPNLYYEERWEERRTRRKGILKQSDRAGSRSYSEEEAKSTTKNNIKSRERRARSESARHDSGERRTRRKNANQKPKSGKHDYNESSTDSESSANSEFNGPEETKTSRHKSKTRELDSRKEEDLGSETDHDEGTCTEISSVSDDSLEVVIVKKSVEKTSERVSMGGRKPKRIPRSEKNSVVTSTRSKTRHHICRKKSDGPTGTILDKGDKDVEPSEPATESKPKTASRDESLSNNNADNKRENPQDHKTQYQNETADSTSQEAVERVTVTVMVHKNELSDTPKSTSLESSSLSGKTIADKPDKGQGSEVPEPDNKEIDLTEGRKKVARPRSARPGSSRSRAPSARTRMDHIFEKADDMQSSLVQKAVDLKKGLDGMREQASGNKTETSVSNRENGDSENIENKEIDEVVMQQDTLITERSNLEPHVNFLKDRILEDSGSEVQSNQCIIGETSLRSAEKFGDHPVLEEDEKSLLSCDEKGNQIKNQVNDKNRDISDVVKSSPTNETGEEVSADNNSTGKQKLKKHKPAKSKRDLRNRSNSLMRTAVEDVPVSDIDEKSLLDKHDPDSEKSSSPSLNQKSQPSTSDEKSDRKVSHPGSRASKSRSSDTQNSGSNKHRPGNEQTSLNENQKTLREKCSDRNANAESSDEIEGVVLSGSRNDIEFEASQEPHSKEVPLDIESDAPFPAGETRFGANDENSPTHQRSRSQKSRSRSQSRPSTARRRISNTRLSSSSRSPTKRGINSSEESSPTHTAIVAVIESPEWFEDEEDEEEAINNEIRDAIGDYPEADTDPDENSVGVMRVLPITSDEETPRTVDFSRTSGIDSLPQVAPRSHPRGLGIRRPSKGELGVQRPRTRNRRDSGGRDSGIEPSPRVSKIPKKTSKCYPNSEKQQALHMETVTRDVQISLRRYHLERKIFFQLMELKRLQIRHGRANEQVLVKRQVEAFHKAGTSGPTLGVAKYDQPLTFRHFESFLYEQLRRLQRRPATPDWCTGAKQCTQKTHRCHHATSAYTSLPVYTYLGVGDRTGSLLPHIEGRGKGQMTVEVTHGEDKQVIALPAERLDKSKRYFVTFTVRGESQEREKAKNSQLGAQRNAKSV